MCSSYIGLAIAGAAIGTKTASAAASTSAANKAAEYNAQIAESNSATALANAGYMEQKAQSIEYSGGVAEKQIRVDASKLKGSQRAAYAASGVVVDTGSALDASVSTAEQAEQDALTQRYNTAQEAYAARMDAYNYKKQAVDAKTQAKLYRSQKSSVALAAGTTLLTGASSLAQSTGLYSKLTS